MTGTGRRARGAARGTRSARPHGRWDELLAALVVVLAVVGMSVSSPPGVGPDEPAHQATAHYTTIHILPPTSETEDYTPSAVNRWPCTSSNATQDASCLPPREEPSTVMVRVLNYPPPYYWVVGLGQKFAPEADKWMDVGGRVASVVLNLAVLLLIWLLTFRRGEYWGTNVLAVATPMAAFMWGVVNPSGWEISAALLFGYFFARAWWNSDRPLGAFASPWLARLTVAVASLVFGLSRHDALVWLVLLVAAVLLLGASSLSRLQRLWLLGCASLGVWAGLLWQLTHRAQHPDNNPDRIADPTLLDHLHWMGQIDAFLPRRLQQMVGVLGSQETPIPYLLVIALIIAWAGVLGMLYSRTRLRAAALAVGAFGILVMPSLLEVLRWNDWPYWYEGRITVPFAAAFLFLVLTRYGRSAGRVVVVLSIMNALLLAYMVWMNLMRYSFGVADYLPLRLVDPSVGDPTFWFVGALVIVMLLATVVRIWWLVEWSRSGRTQHDEHREVAVT